MTVRNLILLMALRTPLAICDERPLDNIASRQYQHEIKPLRLALDRWLQTMELQELAISIRLVKASDLPEHACGMSSLVQGGIGEIDVLCGDEYANRPGCADGVIIPRDQLNTVIHEVLHMVMSLSASQEAKVQAISNIIALSRKRK